MGCATCCYQVNSTDMAHAPRPHRRHVGWIVTTAIIIIIIPSSVSRGIRSGVSAVLSPALRFSSSIGLSIHEYVGNIRSLPTLINDRTTLQTRVVELEQQVANLANAARENEALRTELGITNRPKSDETVAASIISRSTNNVLGEALIDQGSNAGIEVGQAVIAQGALVGRIKAVYDTTAVVSLMSSSDAVVQALLTDSEALGLVTGGPTGLRMTEVNQDVVIRSGEIVQTSGLGGTVPRGLIIGTVDRVISDPGAAKQTVIVQSSVNFDQLRLVFIVLRKPIAQ